MGREKYIGSRFSIAWDGFENDVFILQDEDEAEKSIQFQLQWRMGSMCSITQATMMLGLNHIAV